MGRIVLPQGSMDAERVRTDRRYLDEFARGAGDVIVDFSRVSYLDPSGLGWLAYMRKRVTEQGGRLTIANVHGQPRHVFVDMQLEEFLTAGDDQEGRNRPPASEHISAWIEQVAPRRIANQGLRALRVTPGAMRSLAGALAHRGRGWVFGGGRRAA